MAKNTKKMSLASTALTPAVKLDNPEAVEMGKAAYVKAYGAETTLSDQQIDKLFDDAEGDDEGNVTDVALAKAMRVEEGHDDEGEGVTVSATERERDAIAFGERLDKTKAAEQIAAIVKARDELKWRPAHVAFFMLKEMPKEMLDAAPEPGSKQKDEDGKIVNTIFDVRGPGKGSWWGDAFDSMAYGIAIAQRKAALALVRDRDAAAPADLKAKGRKWAVKELEREDKKRSDGLRALKGGYSLIQRMQWVNDHMRLEAIFVTVDEAGYEKDADTGKSKLTDNAVLEDTTGLIEIRCTVKRRDARFTVSEFMAVKVEDVAKTEDHFANFEVVRAKKQDTGLQVNAVLNVGMFQGTLYEVHAYLEGDKAKGDVLARIHTDEGADIVESLVKTYNALEYFIGRKDVQEMWKNIQAKKNATDKAKQDAVKDAA
jgi:hypothetical protein